MVAYRLPHPLTFSPYHNLSWHLAKEFILLYSKFVLHIFNIFSNIFEWLSEDY